MGIYNEIILLVQICLFISSISADPPNPEINDQFDTAPKITTQKTEENAVDIEEITTEASYNQTNVLRKRNLTALEPNFIIKLYTLVTNPVKLFLSAPKVVTVFRNIGTCVVNGALELVTYYLPAPLIPLIASAAGMLIPFEPVVMLRDKMPVNSYRRAISSAVNSFMGTFDRFKMQHDFEDDPYMQQTFNRRMMNIGDTDRINRREGTVR